MRRAVVLVNRDKPQGYGTKQDAKYERALPDREERSRSTIDQRYVQPRLGDS